MAFQASYPVADSGRVHIDTICVRCWKRHAGIYIGDTIAEVTLQRPEDGASCGYCGCHREPIGSVSIFCNQGEYLVTDEGGSCGARFSTIEEAKAWITNSP